MALQPTNNLPKNTGNKKPQKTNYKVIVITIAVVIAVIVMMIIANLNLLAAILMSKHQIQ